MRNLGCKDILATTDTNSHIKTRVQVASNVKRTLLSVSKLVDAGNRVVFDPRGSFIRNKETHQTVPIYKANGVYKMNLWVPQDTRDPKSITTGRICNTIANDEGPTNEDVNDDDGDSTSGFMRLLGGA